MEDKPTPQRLNSLATTVSTVSAAALTLIYVAAALYMAQKFAVAGPDLNQNYERASSIFAGIQSIGFAAVGVLLGVSVQQPRVAEARFAEQKAKGAIKDIVSPRAGNDLGGGKALPDAVIHRLMEGL